MNKKWINQPVLNSKQWKSSFRLLNPFDFFLPFSRVQLDQHIEASTTFKDDQTTTVVKLELPQGNLVLKRYNPRSFSHKLKRALRRSRADRCWEMSYIFARAGLNVAPPVFKFEVRFGPICRDAYFANQFIQGVELLKALPEMKTAERDAVSDALKNAFEEMQRHRISHGDMKASNLLWAEKQLYFIDLDAARQHKSQKSWQRANRRDRKRFLKNWNSNPELKKLFSWV